MSDDKTNRKVGSVISVANMLVSLVIGLVYTPILIRFLGDNEYGVYTLAMSLISFLSVLDLGFGNALVRYTSREQAKGKEEKNIIGMFLIFYMVIACIAAVLGFYASINMEVFFKSSFSISEIVTLKAVFVILLINTVIAFPASVFSSVIRAHEKFIFANILNLAQNVINHGIMIALLINGFKSVSLAVVTLSSTIVVFAINLFFCFSKLKIKVGFTRFDKPFYREVFVYSAFIFINIIVDQLYASTDKVILAKVCGSGVVAVYGIGVSFQQYFTLFSTSISGIFLPHISKLSVKEDGIREMSDTFLQIGRIQSIILTLIGVGFAVYGRDFIELWAGEGYDDAYFIALTIMVPAIIPLSQNIGISILQALNRHQIRSIMYLCIALLNVLISIPLAVKFGGIGAAIGTAIGSLLGQIIFMNWFYWKRIGIDIPMYWRNISLLLIKMIPVFLTFSITLFIPMVGWGGLLTKIAIGLILVAPYYYFVILTKEERNMVIHIVKR